MAERYEHPPSLLSRHIVEVLDPLLGPFTARRAAELAAEHCGVTPAALGPDQLDAVCDRLRPMLRTLLGATVTDRVLHSIGRPFRREMPPP
jgi:hypothetical protein